MTLQLALYLLLLLLLLFITGLTSSILFVIQRKPWQRVLSCLAGFILVLNALIYKYERSLETTHLLELAGFLWMVSILILPSKNANTNDPIKRAAIIFLIQSFFIVIGELYPPLLFSDRQSADAAPANLYVLPLFVLAALLFYYRKNTGLLLLIFCFTLKTAGTLLYIGTIIYYMQSQSVYEIHLSPFPCIYLAYYTACLYFLFRRQTKMQFSTGKGATGFCVTAGIAGACLLFLF